MKRESPRLLLWIYQGGSRGQSRSANHTNIMPKFIGHREHVLNRHIDTAPIADRKRLLRIPYAQKKLLPQDTVYYIVDTSDKGGPHSLAKRWNRWYALPENVACCPRATASMRAKALPLCHVTF